MWKVEPRLLCDRHLLAEHLEMHMFAGALAKGKSLEGYVRAGLVELEAVGERHELLAAEITARGFHHRSPLPQPPRGRGGSVDVARSLAELSRRCPECRRRQMAG